MTKEQVIYLRNTYGEEKLTMIVFGDGKRVTITTEMLEHNEVFFDDNNEFIVIVEKNAIFSDLMCYRTRSIISSFEYASIIGLIFVEDENDMYYDGENGEGNVFMHRNPRLEESNEVKLKEQYSNIKE